MTPRPSTGARERIVQAAQESYHEQGYHGTTMDEILARAGSTKGSLYYHFQSKEALTEAVILERLMGFVDGFWGRTQWHDDPIGYLQGWIQNANPRALERGCPVNSLAQEVAFSNDSFREALASVFDRWIVLIATGLTAGVRNGSVRSDVDPHVAATYFLACFEGFLSLAKVNGEGPDFVSRSCAPMVAYLESLRPSGSPV